MKIRGIQDERMRQVVERTLESPEWEYLGMSGTTHGTLRHIPTGQTVTFGTTPSGNAWKTFAAKVRRISGLVVWRASSRRPGRGHSAKDETPPPRAA
jgi:hypothetical protein